MTTGSSSGGEGGEMEGAKKEGKEEGVRKRGEKGWKKNSRKWDKKKKRYGREGREDTFVMRLALEFLRALFLRNSSTTTSVSLICKCLSLAPSSS